MLSWPEAPRLEEVNLAICGCLPGTPDAAGAHAGVSALRLLAIAFPLGLGDERLPKH